MKIKNLFKRIFFLLEYYYMKRLIKNTNNIFSYPLFIYMHFNKKDLYEEYLKGKSVKELLIKKLNELNKLYKRKIFKTQKSYSPEVLKRYQKYIDRQNNIKECQYYFGKDCFKED